MCTNYLTWKLKWLIQLREIWWGRTKKLHLLYVGHEVVWDALGMLSNFTCKRDAIPSMRTECTWIRKLTSASKIPGKNVVKMSFLHTSGFDFAQAVWIFERFLCYCKVLKYIGPICEDAWGWLGLEGVRLLQRFTSLHHQECFSLLTSMQGLLRSLFEELPMVVFGGWGLTWFMGSYRIEVS